MAGSEDIVLVVDRTHLVEDIGQDTDHLADSHVEGMVGVELQDAVELEVVYNLVVADG